MKIEKQEVKNNYQIFNDDGSLRATVWIKEDAKIIAQALDVYQKTKLTPQEMLKKYDEAVDLLKSLEHGLSDFDMFILQKFLKENDS
jgi:hypothetical protein